MIQKKSMLNSELTDKIRFLYRKLIPFFLRKRFRNFYYKKLRYFLNPPFINSSVGNRMEEFLEAYKKEINTLTVNSNVIKNRKNFLHKTFNKYEIRTEKIDKNWWSEFLVLSYLPKGEKFNQLNKFLIKNIDESNFDTLEYWELMNISAFSLALGLIEIGFSLRNKALDIAAKYPSNLDKHNSWKLKAKLSACLENRKYSEFDQLIPLLKKRLEKKYFGFFSSLKKRWQQEHYQLDYLRKVLGNYDHQPAKNDILNYDNEQDLKFREFIKGKKIAIVGPLDTTKEDGQEIDKADIVIRFNFLKEKSMGNPIIKGNRCDITYLSGGRSEFIIKNGGQNWSQEVSWIVCKSQIYSDEIIKKFSSESINIETLNARSIKSVDLAMFKGNLLFLPNVIIDLARFEPAKISIFHVDLLLSSKKTSIYASLLPENYEKLQPINVAKNHDIFSQFYILEFFWKQGFIRGDENFERIIKMGIKNYIINYQDTYRDRLRAMYN